jgi:hypothetical protein
LLDILVAVRITLLQSARIVKIARPQRQRTWLLARVEEQRGMVISYLQLFQCVLHQSGGYTPVLIFMYVLIFLCFLLTRSGGLPPC